MKKNLFFYKKGNKFYYLLIFFLLILIFYFVLFYINFNKEYFILTNTDAKNYYIIPDDKEGKKVDFTNLKSINNTNLTDIKKINLNNINNLNYTIQIFSDPKYKNVEKYFDKLIQTKSEILSINEFYIFSINSQIGIDYFLTYKNFESKNEAFTYCNKLNFIKKCLIINP